MKEALDYPSEREHLRLDFFNQDEPVAWFGGAVGEDAKQTIPAQSQAMIERYRRPVSQAQMVGGTTFQRAVAEPRREAKRRHIGP